MLTGKYGSDKKDTFLINEIWFVDYIKQYLRRPMCWNNLNFVVLLPESSCKTWVNTLRPTQNGRHFPDDIFLNENV